MAEFGIKSPNSTELTHITFSLSTTYDDQEILVGDCVCVGGGGRN